MSYLKVQRIVQPVSEVVSVAIPCVLGLVASKITGFGRGAGDQFFIVLAQVLPVLLLAVIVETTLASRAVLDRALTPETQQFVVGVLRIEVSVFAIAEGGLLYAISERTATTFLVVMPTVAALLFLFEMLGAIKRRLGLSEFHVEKLREEAEARNRRRAARCRRWACKYAKRADRLEERLADHAHHEKWKTWTRERITVWRDLADTIAKRAE